MPALHRCSRQASLLHWQRLVGVLDPAVMVHNLAVAPQEPFGGQQALHSHRAPGMDPAGGDADLCRHGQVHAWVCGNMINVLTCHAHAHTRMAEPSNKFPVSLPQLQTCKCAQMLRRWQLGHARLRPKPMSA